MLARGILALAVAVVCFVSAIFFALKVDVLFSSTRWWHSGSWLLASALAVALGVFLLHTGNVALRRYAQRPHKHGPGGDFADKQGQG